MAALIVFAAAPVCLEAQPDVQEKQAAKQEPIHISSDRMVADTAKRTVDFSGNVRMTSSDSILRSDHLKILYKEGGFTGESGGTSEESIDEIIAAGNVSINFDNRVAVADHAIYTVDNGILVLTGKNASISSNKNLISGEKITLHRHDGRVFVESGSEGRVRAVLENEENDSDSTD